MQQVFNRVQRGYETFGAQAPDTGLPRHIPSPDAREIAFAFPNASDARAFSTLDTALGSSRSPNTRNVANVPSVSGASDFVVDIAEFVATCVPHGSVIVYDHAIARLRLFRRLISCGACRSSDRRIPSLSLTKRVGFSARLQMIRGIRERSL